LEAEDCVVYHQGLSLLHKLARTNLLFYQPWRQYLAYSTNVQEVVWLWVSVISIDKISVS